MVGSAVHFQLFMRAVDTDQLQRPGKQGWVAKVHLVIQSPTHHDHQIRRFQCLARGWILVDIGQTHIRRAMLAQKLLVVRNVKNRNRQCDSNLL